MITILTGQLSSDLQKEISVIEQTRKELFDRLSLADTIHTYCDDFLRSSSGFEFLECIQSPIPIKILDIGFGRGESSLYLASKGHTIYAFEPSPLNCQLLEAAACKYNLAHRIKIFQSPVEYADRMQERDFDLCLFNSSLHHCDDPLRALSICKEKLQPKGRVLAMNEPILKGYRTKRWFYKTLQNAPEKLGHYGGNEHIYTFQEYTKLLQRSGFKVKSTLHSNHLNPRQVITENFMRTQNGHSVYSNNKLWLKFTILLIVKSLISKPLTKKMLARVGKTFSLFAFTFEGTI